MTSFFFNNVVILEVLCILLKEKHETFSLKFREFSPCRDTVLRVHGMKPDEKSFFYQIYAIFLETMLHVVIDSQFSLFLKGLKIFNPRRSLIVPVIEDAINELFDPSGFPICT